MPDQGEKTPEQPGKQPERQAPKQPEAPTPEPSRTGPQRSGEKPARGIQEATVAKGTEGTLQGMAAGEIPADEHPAIQAMKAHAEATRAQLAEPFIQLSQRSPERQYDEQIRLAHEKGDAIAADRFVAENPDLARQYAAEVPSIQAALMRQEEKIKEAAARPSTEASSPDATTSTDSSTEQPTEGETKQQPAATEQAQPVTDADPKDEAALPNREDDPVYQQFEADRQAFEAEQQAKVTAGEITQDQANAAIRQNTRELARNFVGQHVDKAFAYAGLTAEGEYNALLKGIMDAAKYRAVDFLKALSEDHSDGNAIAFLEWARATQTTINKHAANDVVRHALTNQVLIPALDIYNNMLKEHEADSSQNAESASNTAQPNSPDQPPAAPTQGVQAQAEGSEVQPAPTDEELQQLQQASEALLNGLSPAPIDGANESTPPAQQQTPEEQRRTLARIKETLKKWKAATWEEIQEIASNPVIRIPAKTIGLILLLYITAELLVLKGVQKVSG